MNDQHFRPHAAHRNARLLTVADMPAEQLPSHLLHPESELVHAMLEELDDVVFSAVCGLSFGTGTGLSPSGGSSA